MTKDKITLDNEEPSVEYQLWLREAQLTKARAAVTRNSTRVRAALAKDPTPESIVELRVYREAFLKAGKELQTKTWALLESSKLSIEQREAEFVKWNDYDETFGDLKLELNFLLRLHDPKGSVLGSSRHPLAESSTDEPKLSSTPIKHESRKNTWTKFMMRVPICRSMVT